ncbi:MAG: DUF935 family protein, partial [Alphaproteobacteria bacterium]|nr:DUF935 family protein [Alphaproteobacteria bacterium]
MSKIQQSKDISVNVIDPTRAMSAIIASRGRALDFNSLGMYLPNPDPILKATGKDIRVYRDLRSDAHVAGCIRRRKASIAALDQQIDRGAAPARVANFIEGILDQLPMTRIISEFLDAALFGYSVSEIMWGTDGNRYIPIDIVGKPPEWFLFSSDNELRFRSKEKMMEGEELPPRKFLLTRQDATYQNPYGFPDLSVCYWPTIFKRGGMRFWLKFTERYGSPKIIGKTPRGSKADIVNELLDNLDKLVGDAVGVIADDQSIELLETKGGAASANAFEKFLLFCRSEVSIALTGTNQTTEADATRASALAGQEVSRTIRDGDVAMVEETMNTLIRWVVDVNFGETIAAPVFRMTEEEAVDKTLAERDAILA